MAETSWPVRAALAAAVVAALALLWAFPAVLFPNPGANAAPLLWSLPMPIIGLTLAAAVAAIVLQRRRGGPAAGSVALGTFVTAVGIDFAIALFTIGNMSDDRFWPLLLSPFVFAPAGVALLLLSLVGRHTSAGEVAAGVVVGVLAGAFLLAWMFVRGPRDWLLAPYGFDVCLLITLECAVVFFVFFLFVAAWRRSTSTAAAG